MDAIWATAVLRGTRSALLDAGSFDVAPLKDTLVLAAERDLAVLVHPMQLPRPEWSDYYLANLVGNPVETATAAAALVLGGILEGIPRLRICLVHGGGCAPGLLGRWQHGWQQRADVRKAGARPPIEGFGDLWFDTLTHDSPALQLLRAHASPGHLMCGSDYPFDMGLRSTADPATRCRPRRHRARAQRAKLSRS